MKYFFIPGRKWELSQAELLTVLGTFEIPHKEISISEFIIIIESKVSQSDIMALFSRLGGFTKVGFLIDDPFEFINDFVSLNQDQKISFSLSSYLEREKGKIFKLGMEMKSFLKEKDVKCRFVNKKNDEITSAPLLVKNKILDKGFELNILPVGDQKEWGSTIAVQDYEFFSKRDYKRPYPNKEKGMIPPKLARIMVNLAGLKEKKTIWDPFCGSGTILQESLLLGLNSIGSDSDPKSIEDTKGNLKWLRSEFDIHYASTEVFLQDATLKVKRSIQFDAIVTEPYIGPVLRSVPGEKRVDNIIGSLVTLYSKFFNNIADTCKTGTKVVFVVPEFKSRTGWKSIKIGDFLPGNFEKEKKYDNLHWDRPNSIIRRQIKIFIKK